MRSIIDVGASNGSWSSKFKRIYPKAHFHLIEANPVHRNSLETFVRDHQPASFSLVAAGDRPGAGYFHYSEANPFGGVASHTARDKECLKVPMVTLDDEVHRYGLQPPYGLKFDTHGFETQILSGATNTLESTELLIIEMYNFDLGNSNLLFQEMCSLLFKQGFRVSDLFDVLYRPGDSFLWQFDAAFLRSSRREFLKTTYL